MSKKTKFDYFDTFKRQTEICLAEADLLIETIEEFTSSADMDMVLERAHALEHRGDELNHHVFNNVSNEFVTPIDREDIISLTQCLDDIIDEIEAIIQDFYMYDIHSIHSKAKDFAAIIKGSCEALDRAMEEFKNFKKNRGIKKLIVEVNDYEEKGDELFVGVIRSLCVDDRDNPMRVFIWSNLFGRMERCCDRCEHVADVMSTVILKNS